VDESPDKIPVIAAPATVVSATGVTPAPARATVAPDTVVASPVTTQEQDRSTQGQRDTSMLWERTQRQIALSIIWAAEAVAASVALTALIPSASERQLSLAMTALVFLTSTTSLVIGFYFGRTNHTKVGGVGGAGER